MLMVYALFHFNDLIGIYSTRELAETAKGCGECSAFDPAGWFVDGRPLDLLGPDWKGIAAE